MVNALPLQLWFAFVCTAGLAIAYPGPTMLTVISYSLTYGRRSYFPVLLAVGLGDSTALALSFLSLHLLASSRSWLIVATFASGIYLLYFGIKRLLANTSPARLNAPPKTHSRLQLFANTYLITGLNPKSIPLLVLFLDGFVKKNADLTSQRYILAVTFVALSIIVATLYVVFAASARKLIGWPLAQRGFQIASGLLLSIAGLWGLGRSVVWALRHRPFPINFL
jgi:threonine/homoserine/homoserine lactone efflux protein